MLLSGKVAVVTGAGRGIGRAAALKLAAEGASVVVNDYGVDTDGRSPDSTPAASVVAEIEAAGGKAVANAGSVDRAADVEELVAAALRHFGRLDAYVNAAGIISRNLIVDTDDDDWDRQIAVHLRGTYLGAKHAARQMIRQGQGGTILPFTSLSGLTGIVGSNAYTTAKAGILGFTWMLAEELRPHRIRVNAIAPRGLSRMGTIPVPEGVKALRRTLGVTLGQNQPKELKPEAVAAMTAYMVSDLAEGVTSEIIGIAGDRIDLWQRPKIAASVFNDGLWTVDAIAKRFPETLGEATAER